MTGVDGVPSHPRSSLRRRGTIAERVGWERVSDVMGVSVRRGSATELFDKSWNRQASQLV